MKQKQKNVLTHPHIQFPINRKKKEKGYVRIIVPLSDNLWKTDAAVDCYYECDFTFLEELKES